ncbi:hypothetical protein LTR78_008146 [Recurvomyces mirabilis]|uniref:CID domain-containing protein n=1 Tax=Recurvomyces mirabilis TaxID=574656 RepID=A0AAE0WH34_9PEZI|nr:hypothetical protein LTR78_008146 [Recurvomyces mirabilis]KAK5150654.1 hypothetical protein LTS14_009937 [Recurvomyces mirabilis]
MADPFEVRMRFTSLLHHLNASTTSALKTASYATKYAEYSDDLHSCILEQLERNNMNNRANIMYFLPSLCDVARERGEVSYGRMMERDILRIVDAVAPDDGSGAANVKVVRKVLGVLEGKGFLQGQTVSELEEFLAGRDLVDGGLGGSPGHAVVNGHGHGVGGGNGVITADATAQNSTIRSTPQSTARDTGAAVTAYNITPAVRLDKRQIEQRIEEDRERHKRAREGLWAVQQESTGLREDVEFERSWEEGGRADEDDWQVCGEERDERRTGLEFEEV